MSKIFSIQALRTIAAVLVCFSHVQFSVNEYALNFGLAEFTDFIPFGDFFRNGVDIFFIVSGFIIYYITHGKTINTDFCKRFISKRAIRIYSMYWVVLIAYLIYVILFSGGIPPEKANVAYVTANFFLIPGFRFIPICWTLAFEMFFYISFFISLIITMKMNTKLIPTLIALLTTFYVISSFVYTGHDNYTIYGSPLVYEFLIGVLIANLYFKKKFLSFKQSIIALGIYAAFAIFNILNPVEYGFTFNYLFRWGTPAAILVYSLLSIEASGINFNNFISKIGDTTYSLYLIHSIFMMFFIRLWIKLGLPDLFATEFLAYFLVLLTMCVGAIIHYSIEKQLLKLFYSRFVRDSKNRIDTQHPSETA